MKIFCIWRERIHTIWHWTQQIFQGSSNSSAQKGKPADEKQSINKSEWHVQPDCLLRWQLMPSLLLGKYCKHASIALCSLLLQIASVSCHGLWLLWAGVKWLAVPMPEFTGGGSRCTARASLSKHLVCFGILQNSNCIINTPLAQLKRQSLLEKLTVKSHCWGSNMWQGRGSPTNKIFWTCTRSAQGSPQMHL